MFKMVKKMQNSCFEILAGLTRPLTGRGIIPFTVDMGAGASSHLASPPSYYRFLYHTSIGEGASSHLQQITSGRMCQTIYSRNRGGTSNNPQHITGKGIIP